MVLLFIFCAKKQIALFLFIIADSCVVSGYNEVTAEFFRFLIKLLMLHKAIATDTGIWCTSIFISLHKGEDYFFLKIILEIQYIVRNREGGSHLSCILYIFQCTAGFAPTGLSCLTIIQLHGYAYTVIAFFFHE